MKRFIFVFIIFFLFGIGIGTGIKYIFAPKPATFMWWRNQIQNVIKAPWFQIIQSEFRRHGYILQTQDIHPPQNSDIVIWAFPKGDLSDISEEQHLVGWLMESPISLEQPLPEELYQKFDQILTYRKDLVDYKKTFFVRIFTRLGDIKKEYWETPKSVLVSQIASYHSYGAYQERTEASKWFLENAPDDFKLYGNGWENIKKELSPLAISAFNQQYGHFVEDKDKAISESKFVLAYENAIQADYVTEKIYDVLKSGAVPVYLGAPNINRYIPTSCFINKNDFKTYDELYAFLKNMDDETYERYRQCAYRFVQRKEVKQIEIAHRVSKLIFQQKPQTIFNWYHKICTDINTFLHSLFNRKHT